MSNLRIVPKNDYDDATLTSSVTEDAGFEVENTQNTIRDKALRAPATGSVTITGVWSASRTVSHASMHRHLAHAGNWRLQLYSDAGATSSVYDSTAVSATSYTAAEPYIWSEGSNDPLIALAPSWLWFTPTAARSFKITLSGTLDPSQSSWQVSRVWIGRYMELARSAAFGLDIGQQDNTDRERTQGGSLRTNEGELWRTMNFDLSAINENELATWVDIRGYAGTNKDIVVSIFPGDGTRREAMHTFAGRFSNLNDIGRPAQIMTMRVQIEEN